MMYSQGSSAMAPPQKPETFMLSDAAQQSLPQDAQVALQQVDNCKWPSLDATRTNPFTPKSLGRKWGGSLQKQVTDWIVQ